MLSLAELFCIQNGNQCDEAYLLHVTQHILPAVKHSPPFFRVQLVDEVCRVVLVTVLIPTNIKYNRTIWTI